MLEKCNGKGVYKLFKNFNAENQQVEEKDYKLFQCKILASPLSG